MNLAATKIELAKLLLSTNDKAIINHIQAVFSSSNENWFENLPAEIKESVTKGLKQSKAGETISHKDVMKKYRKWLKK